MAYITVPIKGRISCDRLSGDVKITKNDKKIRINIGGEKNFIRRQFERTKSTRKGYVKLNFPETGWQDGR